MSPLPIAANSLTRAGSVKAVFACTFTKQFADAVVLRLQTVLTGSDQVSATGMRAASVARLVTVPTGDMPGAERGHDQALDVVSERGDEHVAVSQRDRHQADPDLPARNGLKYDDLSRSRTGILGFRRCRAGR
jgi:hypothetical protein